MFNAYTLHPVATKLPLVIESVTSHDKTLIGGTKTGYLVKYTANQDQHNYNLHVCKNFSKKSVTQLQIFKKYEVLIALSDGLISVHDCEQVNFPVISSLQKIKGVNFFAASILDNHGIKNVDDKNVLCLCVVVRRKIFIYYWHNRDFFEIVTLPDISLADNIRAAVWCCEYVAVAVRDEYFLLNVFDVENKDEVANPQYLFTIGNKSVEPVITPLTDQKKIGFCRDDTMVFVTLKGQPASREGYTDIRWSQVPLSVVYDAPFLLATFPKLIEIRSLKPSNLIQTIDLQKPEFLTLSSNCCLFVVSHPVANMTDLYCLEAMPSLKSNIQNLVKDKQYELAVQLAQNVDDEDDDGRIKRINDIKHLYAFHLYCQRKFEEALKIYSEINAEVIYVIGLFPDLIPEEVRKRITYPGSLPNDFAKNDYVPGLKALARYLVEVRSNNIAPSLEKHNQAKMKLMSFKEDMTEIDKKYLLDDKTESQQKDLLKIVDTTLLKCYLQTDDVFVASLLRLSDNSCDVVESERILKLHKKYYELFLLYERKQMHSAALELLANQAKIKDSPLKSIDRVRYLQNLGNENLSLIFHYAKWILRDNGTEGLKIFIEDCDEVKLLNREKVLEFLMRESPKSVVPYLEHIITQWDDKSVKFHQTLLEQLIVTVKKEMNDYLHSLQPGQSLAPAGKEPGELGVLRTKLLNYLEFSMYYNPELLLVQLPHDSLYEERALILGRLHQHKQAIAIYTNILHEPKKAEAYCIAQYNNASRPEDAQVFLTLLSAYAQPPDSGVVGVRYAGFEKPKPNVSLALTIFQVYAPYIDSIKALALFPTSTRWNELWIALASVLQDIAKRKREAQIKSNLINAQHLSVKVQKMKCQNIKLVINSGSTCKACGKRIGASAFARLADQSLVHYYCLSKD